MKIAYQGIAGSYSESCAKMVYPSWKQFLAKHLMNVLKKTNSDNSTKAIIPSQIKLQEILELNI